MKPKKGGRQVKLWAYGYADLAKLLRTTEGAVRVLICENRFDPESLEEVVAYAIRRLGRSA
jgi:hypothetical protein